MNKPLVISLIVLGIGAVPCLLKLQSLSRLRQDHQKLEAEAISLGLSIGSGNERLTGREREERASQTRAATTEIVSLAKELEAIAKNQGKQSEAYQKRWADLIDHLEKLSPTQLSGVITELRKTSGISVESQREIIGLSIIRLASDQPHTALDLLEEHADFLGKGEMGTDVISSSLSSLAKENPQAALEWIRKNGEKYAHFNSHEIYQEAIGSAAKNDPRLAFKLLGELKLEDPSDALGAIVETGNTSPEKRNAVLAALREHLGGITNKDERDKNLADAFKALAQNLDPQGMDVAAAWISKSKFTVEEKQHFANGLNYFSTKQDTGKWIQWMTENIPAEKLSVPVAELVSEWTQQDYQASGTWLAASPESPAKQTAVLSYAKAIAEYEPQVANQWAKTIPPGPIRDETLKVIYRNWPSNDPQGAAAFATEHQMN